MKRIYRADYAMTMPHTMLLKTTSAITISIHASFFKMLPVLRVSEDPCVLLFLSLFQLSGRICRQTCKGCQSWSLRPQVGYHEKFTRYP